MLDRRRIGVDGCAMVDDENRVCLVALIPVYCASARAQRWDHRSGDSRQGPRSSSREPSTERTLDWFRRDEPITTTPFETLKESFPSVRTI